MSPAAESALPDDALWFCVVWCLGTVIGLSSGHFLLVMRAVTWFLMWSRSSALKSCLKLVRWQFSLLGGRFRFPGQ